MRRCMRRSQLDMQSIISYNVLLLAASSDFGTLFIIFLDHIVCSKEYLSETDVGPTSISLVALSIIRS